MTNNPLDKKPFIIADVGSNWRRKDSKRGNYEAAMFQVLMAAYTGVSAVKFQYFTHKDLYGVEGIHPYSLPREWLGSLRDEANKHGVEFMCSAFSPEGIDIVDPFVNVHKLASSEMNHTEMIERLKGTGKPVIASTAAETEESIYKLPNDFHILECVGAYPAREEDYALDWTNYNGISDHTLSSIVAVAAVGMGAFIFEKHFDGIGGVDTPDTCVSYDIVKMNEYCTSIKKAWNAVYHRKGLREVEKDMWLKHKRRLIVTKPVKEGDKLIYNDNYGAYRSRYEVSEWMAPELRGQVEGKLARVALEPGAVLLTGHTR